MPGSPPHPHRPLLGAALLAVTLVVTPVTVAPRAAGAAPPGGDECEQRVNDTLEEVLECVDVEGARRHLVALQEIGDEHHGTRSAGTPGYRASVDYVAERMRGWGYDVTVQAFDFPFFHEFNPPRLENQSEGVSYEPDEEVATMAWSGAGEVTATARGVDLVLPPAGEADTSTSGCEAEDFDGFPAGGIAVVQRGSCSFAHKAANAEAAEAAAVVIFNEGQEGRRGLLRGTLGSSEAVSIPVVGTSFEVGTALPGDTVSLTVETASSSETWNVLAETRSGRTDNVVMVGAHLDSVLDGPGIQDNGSGTAALLEVAEAMQGAVVDNQIRFAWWGAEEAGLVGSARYVSELSQQEVDDISLYLNFDMIASPNYVRFVYDGDGSSFGDPGPDGSGAIETLFRRFYRDRGLESEPTRVDGRSDYAPFETRGVPFGGVFTGAGGLKTPQQAVTYGGTAGQPYDPCYHRSCDTLDNVNLEVLDVNLDAVGHGVMTYAGTVARQEPAPSDPDDPVDELLRDLLPDLLEPSGDPGPSGPPDPPAPLPDEPALVPDVEVLSDRLP